MTDFGIPVLDPKRVTIRRRLHTITLEYPHQEVVSGRYFSSQDLTTLGTLCAMSGYKLKGSPSACREVWEL